MPMVNFYLLRVTTLVTFEPVKPFFSESSLFLLKQVPLVNVFSKVDIWDRFIKQIFILSHWNF